MSAAESFTDFTVKDRGRKSSVAVQLLGVARPESSSVSPQNVVERRPRPGGQRRRRGGAIPPRLANGCCGRSRSRLRGASARGSSGAMLGSARSRYNSRYTSRYARNNRHFGLKGKKAITFEKSDHRFFGHFHRFIPHARPSAARVPDKLREGSKTHTHCRPRQPL